MSDGASSEVSNAQSLLIRLLANFPGCLGSLGVQGLAHSGCEPKLINWVSSGSCGVGITNLPAAIVRGLH